MADFMRPKYDNPKMRQSEIANQLGLSSSTLQRYRNEINMLSPYRISVNNTNNTKKRSKKASNTNFDDDSRHEADVKRPKMTSIDLKRPQSTSTENSKRSKTKNNLKGGLVQDNIEINEHYLDKILENNDS